MKIYFGIALIVAGIVLLWWGAQAADAPLSVISKAVTGEPSDRAMQFYISGAVATVVGIALVLPLGRLRKN